VPLLRTGAAVGSLITTVLASAGFGLALGDRAAAVNLAGAFGPDIALAVAGVRLDVTGRDNLWTRRPAVFMFNHQSALDLPIVGSLVRRDLTAVAKIEARRDPRFAAIGALLDVAYVDRSNTARARAALDPAVDRLHEGISLVIAPEGTRSPTPRLGRFKKGGFHVALAANVPIVPIVIRNAGELMWRNSLIAHSGTVEVAVLPPIETDDFEVADIDKLVDKVRSAFEETLSAWPGTSTM
jgi:putative phosphoserine phosphatase/1-acylglycerol-3-phosphate O-acyltransferase